VRELLQELVLDDFLIERGVLASAAFARILKEKLALAHRCGGKSVCLDDLRARLEKAPMNVLDRRAERQRVDVAVVLEILGRLPKPLAPHLLLGVPVVPDRRAHGAVDKHDALGQRAAQGEFGRRKGAVSGHGR
jgi:hypothetical protein